MRFRVEKFKYPGNIIGDAAVRFSAKLLPLFLWIALARGFAQQEQTDEFAQLVAQARQSQATADYAEAAAVYKKAVKLRSDIPELWANLGLMQNAVGSYREAIASFREAVRLKPALYVPNLFLGIDYTHVQQGQEAIPFLIKAETITPSDPQAPLSLGRAYLSVGNFAGARSAFARATMLDAKNSSAWFGYGVAALDEVEVNGRKLSSEDANSAWAKALFAESLVEQSRWKEAVSQQQAVLAADPRFPCGHAQLGFFYLAQQEDTAASREFASEASGCALAALGRVRLRLNAADYAGALALLTALWEHDAGFVRTHTALLTEGSTPEHASAFPAFLDQQGGGGTGVDPDLSAWLSAAFRGVPSRAPEMQQLSSIAASSIAVRGGSAVAADERDDRYSRCAAKLANGLGERNNRELLLLASCAFMTGDYGLSATASDLLASRSPHDLAAFYWSVKANEKLAFAALDRFEQLKPDAERTHLLLGDMYRQRQRFEQAENEYKTAAKLSPQDAAPLFGLASAYSQNSETEQALSAARAGLQITPSDPDLNLLIGEILVSRHAWDEAEPFLNKSLDAKPQTLPHVHVLLGEVYEGTGRTGDAISQLKMGLAADDDGSVYYRLSRIYTRVGNKAAADEAMQHVKALEESRRQRAVVAVQDSSAAMQDDIR
jgi:tetratricopeptide (TPR) repeat protein